MIEAMSKAGYWTSPNGLTPHATVEWYADLSHDLLTAPPVRAELTRFIAGYRP